MSPLPAFNAACGEAVHRPVHPRGARRVLGRVLLVAMSVSSAGGSIAHAAAGAAAKPTVAYGGFAFAGAASANAQRYPLLSEINVLTDDGTPFLSRLAREIFAEQRGAFVQVQLAPGLVRRQSDPMVLALAATSEFVQQEQIAAGQKLVVTLGFDLVLLNFDSFEILSSQPFLLEFVHVGRGAREPFSVAAILDLIREPLLQGPRSELRQALAVRLPLVAIRERNRANLRVNPVVVAPAAVPNLPAAFRDDVPAYAELVGQIFTAMLAKFADVAVLPHTKDQLNASMALSFADGSVIQFRIPQPSYAANLRVRGFRKVRFDETAAEIGWIFGTSLDVSVEIASDQPDLRATLFAREALKGVVRDKVPASQSEVDEAVPFFEAVIDGIGAAIDEMKKDKKAREGFLKLCKT